MLLGTYVGIANSTDPTTNLTTDQMLASFQNAVGQAPTLKLVYLDQSQPESQWASNNAWEVSQWQSDPTFSAGSIPVLGIPMAQAGDTADQDFKTIASGAWDSMFQQVFSAWANAGYKTFYIRPGWEMNGTWQNWSVTSANAQDFIAAFQHIAALAHGFSGANIQVVWNPNQGGSLALQDFYPGNASVDVIGLDTYGAPVGQDTDPQATSSGSDVELSSIIAFAKQQGKPFALPETGAGATDTAFPTNLANALTAANEPLAFMNVWDVPEGGSSSLQWSTNSAASAAWSSAIKTIAAIGGTSTSTTDGATSTTTSSGVTSTTTSSSVTSTTTSSSGTSTSTSSGATSTTTSSGGASTTTSSGPDTLALRISEDFWKGNAKFTVAVDGKQVGGTYTASALHATGDSDVFLLTGNWGAGPHKVAVSFINDAWGGTPSTDRNLYVNSIAYDGKTDAGTTAAMWSNGSKTFTVGGATPTTAGPADTLTIKLSEDAWQGNADFVLHIDGETVTKPEAVTALHSQGQWETFTFAGNFGAGAHTVGIQFTNDAYGGTPTMDRNLYVGGIAINGTSVSPDTASLYSAGTANFTIHTAA